MSAWAFLIGINDYQYLTRLRYAVADIEAFAQALVRDLAFAPERVIRMSCDMKGENRPDAAGIEDRLFWVARQLEQDDTLVFAFTGHGFQLPDGRTFLAAVDTRIGERADTLERSAVSMHVIEERLRQAATRQTFLVLDCCRDDPLPGKGLGGGELAEGLVHRVEALTRDVTVQPVGRLTAGRAFAALFACGPGEKACEWEDRQHGVFWAYFLEALSGAGSGPDGRVTAHSVAEYVYKRVQRKADELFHRTQTPHFCQVPGAPVVELGRVRAPTARQAHDLSRVLNGLRSSSFEQLRLVVDGLRERRCEAEPEGDRGDTGGQS